jgi:hypothetical protein
MNTRTAFENTHAFGRLPSLDPRDRKYRVRVANLLAEIDPTAPTSKYWTTGLILDQGVLPHCVEFSGRQFLKTSPVRNDWRHPSGWLYRECQKVDEWEGEYDGTSVRALFKTFKTLGIVDSYGWAFTNAEVASWLLIKGPMVLGTDWHEGMMETDADGFIRASGTILGGHAWCIVGTNSRMLCPDGSLGAHRLVNSWGRRWGQSGRAWISYRDTQMLLDAWGEACTATELLVK